MYPLFSVQALLEIWKIKYCESDYSKCARYQLGREGKGIPPNLLPNGTTLDIPKKG
jgi:hypothetical protein